MSAQIPTNILTRVKSLTCVVLKIIVLAESTAEGLFCPVTDENDPGTMGTARSRGYLRWVLGTAVATANRLFCVTVGPVTPVTPVKPVGMHFLIPPVIFTNKMVISRLL
ncbi:hypothetical protein OIN60_20625 [Paenibacillus sp. P96]|uniref:Secreted protein n=1 Tax=Paenibacillus zeirhizosphaerae TaxID=2987519 RepID=A0ABT9FWW1_9BACL|nr:hypothetical protein [Paenibacillus sp. P96]MDP4099129.1 hypothetical protein [Paenibacillus sp. P96]